MEQLGSQLAHACSQPSVIHLCGELGVGKTTLVRGFVRALGHRGNVKSPTFTLIELYQLAKQTIYHLDLYRLGHPEELEYLGLRDYVAEGTCLIEWPERGYPLTPPADIYIQLCHHGEARLFSLQAYTTIGRAIVAQLS